MQTAVGMRRRPAPRTAPAVQASLPGPLEEVAQLHLATLTAAAFLAPKGVACTLGCLSDTVRSMAKLELTAEALRKIVAIDSSLALRHAIVTSDPTTQQLELVLRDSLRVVASPGAVRARHKFFRSLLAERVASSSDTPLTLPLVPLPNDAPGLVICPSSMPVGGRAQERPRSPQQPRCATDLSGLPSPPPRPLRQMADPARPSPQMASLAGTGFADDTGPAGDAIDAGDAGCSTTDSAATSSASAAFGQQASASTSAPRPTSPVGRAQSRADAFLAGLTGTGSGFYKGQIKYKHEQAARAAQYARPSVELAPAVLRVLNASGLTQLYSHQAAAIDALICGGHVMLATPTASGKSLGYNVPTLQAMASSDEARALYIFPTKALAQDQLRALRTLSCAGQGPLFGLRVDTYACAHRTPSCRE